MPYPFHAFFRPFLGCMFFSIVLFVHAQRQPNIVLIFIDDFSSTALGCYGGQRVPTPHIDALTENGVLFTDAYVTPQCTPSRASLMTGQHTARIDMWHVIGRYGFPYARLLEPAYRENMPHDFYTVAEALQDEGYRTALLGKWHLSTWGDRYPNSDGYYTTLFQHNKDEFGFDYVDIAPDPNYHQKTDKGVQYLTQEALQFMETDDERPFFIYLSHHTIHGPVLAPDSLINKYLEQGFPKEGTFNATYLAAIEWLDHSIGTLIEGIEDLGLTEETIIIFYTDNGGVESQYDNDPIRAGKGSHYEGGIRVPLIIKWPGVTETHRSEYPVHVVDMFPTLLEMAGAESIPTNLVLDGVSFVDELKGIPMNPDRDLYWYMPLYDYQWGATPTAVIRSGQYKLIKFFGDYYDYKTETYTPEARLELYDLKADIGETHNLVQEKPHIAELLENRLMNWLTKDMRAQLPVENPHYDRDRIFERTNSMNFRPFIRFPLSDIHIKAKSDFKHIIPKNKITDYDFDRLSTKLTLESGDPLPEWINFNAFESTIIGHPPHKGSWQLKFSATDSEGASVSQMIQLHAE